LEDSAYRLKLATAGFEAIDIEPARVYKVEDARQFLVGVGIDADVIAAVVDGTFMSAFVRAKKPVSSCQIAEGYLRQAASDRYEALSAGIEPKGLNPLAVQAMAETGIGKSLTKNPKTWDFFSGSTSLTSSPYATMPGRNVPSFRERTSSCIGASMIRRRPKEGTRSGLRFFGACGME
jgi:hypothetical protein